MLPCTFRLGVKDTFRVYPRLFVANFILHCSNYVPVWHLGAYVWKREGLNLPCRKQERKESFHQRWLFFKVLEASYSCHFRTRGVCTDEDCVCPDTVNPELFSGHRDASLRARLPCSQHWICRGLQLELMVWLVPQCSDPVPAEVT